MIQVFGTRKSRDTQKALRFFKERGVPVQFIDMSEKPMSRGELESVARAVPLDALMDSEGGEYKKLGFAWREHDPLEALLENPLLFRMPVVRDGRRATAGPAEQTWKEWLEG